MYPKRMKWVDLYLMRSDLTRVVDKLHDTDIIQLEEGASQKDRTLDLSLIETKSKLDKMVDFLSPMETKKKGLLASFLDDGTEKLEIAPSHVKTQVVSWLKKAEGKVSPLRSEIDQIIEDQNYSAEIKDKFIGLTGLDVDLLAMSSLSRIKVKVGTTRRYSELKDSLKRVDADLEGSLMDKKEGIHSVRILYPRSSSDQVENVLRGRLFAEINLDIPKFRSFLKRRTGSDAILSQSMIVLIKHIEKIQDKLTDRLEEVRTTGSSLATDLLPGARSWRESVEIELDKKNAATTFSGTEYTNHISGYVEADRINELRTLLELNTRRRFHMDHRDPTNEEIEENRVPTKLKNNKFVSLFEPLTTTFSTPKYNEIDPSAWVSIPFILFFGLMLGDAGYGLLILLPSLYLFSKGKKSKALRSIGALGILMGLATTLSGIWMGAFFGDLIPRLIYNRPGDPLFTLTVLGYTMPYDTLKDPMLLFQISLWLGLAQLNFGFLLLGIDRLKKKKIWGFIKGTVSWVLIQTGAIIFIGAMLIGWWELNSVLTIVGASTFISGSILLIFEVGPMFLFDIEGLLGDWISYTRILALGLSTFGLAMAFNIVGEMLVDIHWALVFVVVFLLLGLHVFNLLLQALGAAVHSIRLQFVEFFGRFFEGGGEMFEPFGREREFTKGSEENISMGGIK